MNSKNNVLTTNTNSTTDYIRLYSKIEEEIKNGKLRFDKSIKIAILASFTINVIKEVLFVKCCQIGLLPDIYVGNYKQYTQEILNQNSTLHKFKPELVIIIIDTMTVFGDNYFMPYQINEYDRKKFIDSQLNSVISLVSFLKENSSATILLHNFMEPLYSPLGILENKQNFGFVQAVAYMNNMLNEAFNKSSQVFVFDFDSFASRIGKHNIMDHKMYYVGDMKISFEHFPALIDQYLAYIKPLKSLNKKCLVLDLDNTLWGGVIGEDGIDSINLGPDPKGRPYFEFQKYILSLFDKGVILAVNSKNNLNDALEVFRKHPYSILKEEHFASLQINWNDKISNMKAITDELNIGLDSIVYIDDDKLNREIIREALPEVLVVELPEDQSLYPTILMEINDFNTLQIVEEDKLKGKIYAEQRTRKEFEKTATDMTEYLKGLMTIVTIEKANSFNIPRISQLTQKTNQFNMTTRRYTEEDIKGFSSNQNFIVFCSKAADKFGDNGIVGAAIIEKGKEQWRIDTFLLSCRVIGRKIEESMLAYILSEAKNRNANTVLGEFIPTKKNAPAKPFYQESGFVFERSNNSIEMWLYRLQKEFEHPPFIKVIIKDSE